MTISQLAVSQSETRYFLKINNNVLKKILNSDWSSAIIFETVMVNVSFYHYSYINLPDKTIKDDIHSLVS